MHHLHISVLDLFVFDKESNGKSPINYLAIPIDSLFGKYLSGLSISYTTRSMSYL